MKSRTRNTSADNDIVVDSVASNKKNVLIEMRKR